MGPRSQKQALCQICSNNPSKYTCSKCYIAYCSVPCYKGHQQATCVIPFKLDTAEVSARDKNSASSGDPATSPLRDPGEGSASSSTITDTVSLESRPLRSLTSLNWPYVPEESAFPDPLKRDDPKDLQLRHYEAIATSPQIREILSKHENLPALLTSIDKLRGVERERALQKALQVTPPDIDDWRKPKEHNEDVLALRELAEALEAAIRGGNDAALGLNWGEES